MAENRNSSKVLINESNTNKKLKLSTNSMKISPTKTNITLNDSMNENDKNSSKFFKDTNIKFTPSFYTKLIMNHIVPPFKKKENFKSINRPPLKKMINKSYNESINISFKEKLNESKYINMNIKSNKIQTLKKLQSNVSIKDNILKKDLSRNVNILKINRSFANQIKNVNMNIFYKDLK